ncbi:MAG: phosphatase PAP2 family protein [Acidimicrobiia bacterium]
MASAWCHRHDNPPFTPAGILLRSRLTVSAIVAAFVALAAVAAIDGGALLLVWDEPVQGWVESHRTATLDRFFLFMSRLGSTAAVVIGLATLLALTWRRCRPLFVVVLMAMTARPVLEWTLKVIIDRDRPDLDRLVGVHGPSFPSGHAMAAIALFGLVPPVVALLTHRRVWWWVATVTSGLVALLVAASRVYLGVHWLSDVVGTLLLGSLFLVVVELILDVAHGGRVRTPASTVGGQRP